MSTDLDEIIRLEDQIRRYSRADNSRAVKELLAGMSKERLHMLVFSLLVTIEALELEGD